MHSEQTGQKRKRAEGAIMPTLREAIDPETGEVFRFETSKDVKKRYKQNGATWRPTAGQINAADIWNKQEAETERKRVLEEKRKKNKAKEALKQEKLKEQQQELLAKGRISVEDTWGKANASQMRLNKFFAAPKPARNSRSRSIIESPRNERTSVIDAEDPVDIEDTEDTEDTEDAESVEVGHDEPDILVEVQDDEQQNNVWVDEDLYDLFTNSPLTPEEVKKKNLRSPMKDKGTQDTSCKRKSQALSQHMMPPPKRARRSESPKSLRIDEIGPVKSSRARQHRPEGASSRTPLQDISASRVNVQNYTESNQALDHKPVDAYLFPATQVVRDTLLGLCSQDFTDDFDEDSDDCSAAGKLTEGQDEERNTDKTTDQATRILSAESQKDNILCQPVAIDDFEYDSNNMSLDDFDEFDDEGIDDESLLALAATQQLQRELDFSSQPTSNAIERPTNSVSATAHQAYLQIIDPLCVPNSLGESFGMDGLDDSDLLEELANYESNIEDCDNEQNSGMQKSSERTAISSQRGSMKKSRTLPWVKNPISFCCDGDYAETENDAAPGQ